MLDSSVPPLLSNPSGDFKEPSGNYSEEKPPQVRHVSYAAGLGLNQCADLAEYLRQEP